MQSAAGTYSMTIWAKSIWPVTGQSEVKSAVSKRIRYGRLAGLGNVSSFASAGEAGSLVSLRPSRVRPLFRFATWEVNVFQLRASMDFQGAAVYKPPFRRAVCKPPLL